MEKQQADQIIELLTEIRDLLKAGGLAESKDYLRQIRDLQIKQPASQQRPAYPPPGGGQPRMRMPTSVAYGNPRISQEKA